MSTKTKFLASLMAVVATLKGAHLTREARERTSRRFAAFCVSKGFTHLLDAADLRGKQIRIYIATRKKEGVTVRTLQNEMAHIRQILRASGRSSVADAPELSNKALEIGGGSRTGKKRAMTEGELDRFVQVASKLKRPGMGALLCLEWHLGLRGNEAIHARVDTLERWDQELSRNGKINVLAGTKGGRTRTVDIFDVDAARKAVRNALAIAREQGEFLVARRDGKRVGGLKQARSIYHSWCRRHGVVPHAARYTFAQRQYVAYQKTFGDREALVAVSRDLGHGDGRGRWIRSVYGHRPPKDAPV
jgi:integrase